MNLIDFILNIVGLLLWLNWRAIHLSPIPRPGASIAANLKPANPPRTRWLYLGWLLGLLLARSFFYWQIGSALPWHPHLALGPTTLTFRSDFPGRMLLYSFFSFGVTLAIFYLWMLVISCVNSRALDNDPQQRFIQLHLGLMDRGPVFLKMILPMLGATILWFLINPFLVTLQMLPKTTHWHIAGQGALIGAAVYLQLKYLLVGFFALHLLNSYLYIGDQPFWNFISVTSRGLLRPIRWLPLQAGKIDFAPALAILLLFLAEPAFRHLPHCKTLDCFGLACLFQKLAL